MKKRRKRKSRASTKSHPKLKRFFFRCAISAAALVLVLFINFFAPALTKPLSEALHKSTDIGALKSSFAEYIQRYSAPAYEASTVK